MVLTIEQSVNRDKQELLDLLEKYNMSTESRRPYGILEQSISYFSEEDKFVLHYNSYFSKSLLNNDNKWL